MSATEKTPLRRRLVNPDSASQTTVSESTSTTATDVTESTQTVDDASEEGGAAPAEDDEANEDGGVDAEGSGETKLTPRKHKNVKVVHHKPRMRKRAHTAIFLLGSLFGILAAGFFAKRNDLIDFPIGEISMDSFLDVLPRSLVADMRDLVVCSLIMRTEKSDLAPVLTNGREERKTTSKATTPSRWAPRRERTASRSTTPSS